MAVWSFGGSVNFGTISGNGINTFPSFDPINIHDAMSVIINGRAIKGKNVSMINGVLYVDGKEYDASNADDDKGNNKYGKLAITITGNVNGDVKTTSGGVHVVGDASSISTMSGGVAVGGNVSGSASTMSGSLTVHGDVGGRVSTMSGSIVTMDGRGTKKRRKGED